MPHPANCTGGNPENNIIRNQIDYILVNKSSKSKNNLDGETLTFGY